MADGSAPSQGRNERASWRQDRELYSSALDWYLTQRDADCGVRSTLAAQIAAIERGGAYGVPCTDPYHDGQAGLSPHAHGAFSRDRIMRARWVRLARPARELLVVYYVGSEPVESDPKSFGSRETEWYTPRRRFPLGVEPTFGKFAAVVLWQARGDGAEALARVLRLAEAVGPSGSKDTLSADRRRAATKLEARAELAVRVAHLAYHAIVATELGRQRKSRPWHEQWDDLKASILERRREAYAAHAFHVELAGAAFPVRGEDGIWR